MSDSGVDPKDGRDQERYRHTRTSAAWVAVAVAVIFGIALIDFIAQNTRHVRIEFFWASGRIPVAVALLGAALAGAVVVLAVGVGRVAQLRLKIRRQRRGPKAPSDVERNVNENENGIESDATSADDET
ncbi:MAG TPA: lipopolysaccharide assembly protein LapA domain-containing protein [Acidimicrobiales bacterium]